MTPPAVTATIAGPMDEPFIRLHGVSRSYADGARATHALRDVTIDVRRGEFVAIVGTSGSGKTTLLNLIGGLDRPTAGSVVVVGRDLAAMSDEVLSAFRADTVGFVFQAFHLLGHLTVIENVGLPHLFSRVRRRTADERAREVLGRVGLEDRANDLPAVLSGGQRQRVAIARAIFNAPAVLLGDEPTGNLDDRTAGTILELFRSLHAEGLTVVVVTHEERVSAVADRTVRLEAGAVVA